MEEKLKPAELSLEMTNKHETIARIQQCIREDRRQTIQDIAVRFEIGYEIAEPNISIVLMRRAKTPSCRRCGAEKETSVHILCECPVLEKVRMQT